MAKRNWLLFGIAGALAACAGAPKEEVDRSAAEKLAQFERTGETTACIGLRQISQITPVTESTFLVRVGAGDYYANDVSGRCNGATRNSTRLEYSTTLSELCRNELIRVIDNATGVQVGGCGLGSFEKLQEKPPADDSE
jgi:hypothetical protein